MEERKRMQDGNDTRPRNNTLFRDCNSGWTWFWTAIVRRMAATAFEARADWQGRQ
uniref:Uncharacterized protein n=1 Tax=Hyaloperonospora arabidopsidis (strain Emoy2) TaxID=559515 RepID=M4B1L8_HYAAE